MKWLLAPWARFCLWMAGRYRDACWGDSRLGTPGWDAVDLRDRWYARYDAARALGASDYESKERGKGK